MTAETSKALAAALVEAGAPGEMVTKALNDHYHDFLSPLAFPEMELLQEARAAGLEAIAQGVLEGKWDATKAESDEWAKSEEGQRVFRELLDGSGPNKKRKGHRG